MRIYELKRRFLLPFVLFVCPASYGQSSTTTTPTAAPGNQQPAGQPAPATPEAFVEQLKETVVFIEGKYARQMTVRSEDGTSSRQNLSQSILGTGYLISMNLNYEGQNAENYYLVTNKHMIREPGPDGKLGEGPYLAEIQVRFNAKAEKAVNGPGFRIVTVPVMNSAGLLNCFIDLADVDADLAICPVPIDFAVMAVKVMQPAMFVTSEKITSERINETSEVLFAGLFAPFIGVKRNYPVVRHGKIAMLAGERMPVYSQDRSQEVYLADVMSFGGNSGSPVIVRVGGLEDNQLSSPRYYLLGTMQGYFNVAASVAVQTGTLTGSASENTGVAIVVPAKKINEILSSAEVDYCRKSDFAQYLENSGQWHAAFDLSLEVDKAPSPSSEYFGCEFRAHQNVLREAGMLHVPPKDVPVKYLPTQLPNLPSRLNIKSSVAVDFAEPVAQFGTKAKLFQIAEDAASYTFVSPTYIDPQAKPFVVPRAQVRNTSYLQ